MNCHLFAEYCLDQTLTTNFSWALVLCCLNCSQRNFLTDKSLSVELLQALTQLLFSNVIHCIFLKMEICGTKRISIKNSAKFSLIRSLKTCSNSLPTWTGKTTPPWSKNLTPQHVIINPALEWRISRNISTRIENFFFISAISVFSTFITPIVICKVSSLHGFPIPSMLPRS